MKPFSIKAIETATSEGEVTFFKAGPRKSLLFQVVVPG